jgi:hypothetical protein
MNAEKFSFRKHFDRILNWWRRHVTPTQPPPTPSPPPAPVTGDDLSNRLLAAHNVVRAQHGLPPLRLSSQLTASATRIATLCAQVGRLDHYAGGSTPSQRITAAGYHYSSCGENLASGNLLTPEGVVQVWLDDPPHRANVLGTYQDVGFSSQAGVWAADYGTPLTNPLLFGVSSRIERLPGGIHVSLPPILQPPLAQEPS